MNLDKAILEPFISNALAEDIGDGDHTSLSTIPKGQTGKAKLLIKDNGIIAGIDVSIEIFKAVDATLLIDILIQDGETVKPGDIAFYVSGSIHSILKAERLVLNTMQRMSGIASTTNRIVKILEGTGTKVLDTRKTTPGLRYLEKLAVRIGGGVNHRFGLYDMILIKDNHVDYAGGISNAIKSAQNYLKENKINIPVEVEVRNLEELKEVMQFGQIDRILLDNFSFSLLKEAVKRVNGSYITEASGGITEDNVLEYANCGVDYVSMGALTHSVKSLDMSLKAVKP
ncbi:MAG: nicotinate-nucleotide diphosphorylase (carboxylating) [Sphingobacteriales bacterium 17-39-43]|uniref:carboxylating nicotinate-nucleotide diphosphorylase n=1 Tax=Daejeonella sp. TaxID=2805397 RepID=UPI000BD6595F|nr:carboxylating nicotinate-nucleotide diphosphorylase [Daejeonella sp.]OYZ33315.1 MAG: nicotinate-nucleotide diphosphorylase (carboxylating) [Sphingobacteriales bacterium 16-39-50]OZA26724.1 MAG: nicotinate-nucleotide diphosphorylase (carboxylating) [Sphingobacteriales bacterium 17-39-43]OZA58494.1 MAG: nicotinate-nucleotide diphosphorylase (carboxylating) [Sphingobacteriales bacterium 39-40-5]HQS51897.1 carboxylating nicotinate-nucleotide diphosphorylase [Daejeonella sp.]HQT22328.1 carboxyla